MVYLLRRRRLGKTSCEAIAKFSKSNIKVIRNDGHLPTDDSLCIRWGCTSTVPQKSVLNRAEAIHRVGDKTGFRKLLEEHDLCPITWFSVEQFQREADDSAFPVIVRPQFHHQGRHLFACNNLQDVRTAFARCGEHPYISKFIPKVAEYRVFAAQGRAVCVARKTPGDPNDVAWNVARGGRFDNVRWDDWPLKAVRVSLEAFALSGLDFGGVDIMVDGQGECYVLEINAAPSLTSEYRQKCFARVFDYMVTNGKEIIPLVKERGGYSKFIHPAIAENARV